MKYFQPIAIWTIAAVLAVQFYVAQIRPELILDQEEENYLRIATECHQAIGEREQIHRMRGKISPESFKGLLRSSDVFMMNCYKRDELRLSLLVDGISRSELDLLELRAKKQSNSPLSYFINGAGSSR